MTNTNKWNHIQTYDEYYDFDKELYSLPDAGNTSVDMRMTFNTETRTCYYNINLHNDDGDTRDWDERQYVPWAVGLEMLRRDNTTIPEELTK